LTSTDLIAFAQSQDLPSSVQVPFLPHLRQENFDDYLYNTFVVQGKKIIPHLDIRKANIADSEIVSRKENPAIRQERSLTSVQVRADPQGKSKPAWAAAYNLDNTCQVDWEVAAYNLDNTSRVVLRSVPHTTLTPVCLEQGSADTGLS